MPRDSNGNYTLPLPDVVGGDVIDAGDFNTTMDDLATAMQDSLSRSGKGGMQVAFEFADGTVGAPAITWTNETSAGFYRISAGEFGYSVGGSKVLNINASGIDGVIGATTPAAGSFTSISFDDVGSNWTNAGRTIADLGAVTTADINGGTLDGVAIGATTPAAATVTTFTSNGIDDNATSTQLTITDTESTFGGNLTMSDGKLVQTDSLSGNTVATFANTSTTNPNGMYIATSNYAGNASNYLIRGANSGGNAFSIYTDGSADFADVTLSNGKLVQSDSLSGNTVATFANIASSNPNIMYMAVNNYAGNASNYFLRGDNSNGSAFNIYTDGSAYYSGGLYLGAKGSANLLDDYEVGTFTAEVADTAVGGNTGTATVNCHYVKIGDICKVTISLRDIDTTGMTGSNSLHIRNLPFVTKNSTNLFGGGTVTLSSTAFSGKPDAFLFPNGSYILLRESISGSVQTFVLVSDLTSGSADLYVNVVYQVN